MSRSAEDWIAALALRPHPEGGAYRETWRSDERLSGESLPGRFGGARSLGTAIVYLLRAHERSRFHRLRADELWHLYDGGPLDLHVLVDGRHERRRLGLDPAAGEQPQVLIPHGTWFAAEPASGAPFALAGCTVSPGFEFEDWELGRRDELLAAFPGARDVIEKFTDE